ncbi:MAG: hypothetical protein PVG78_05065 [Desulfobacterales bacterium]|jgi:hypothetical protein
MEPINLFKEPKRFGELPKTVKMAILTLFGGWIVHFTIIYSVFRSQVTDKMLLQHLGLAVISCFVLLKLKNWARILCLTGNAIVLLFYLVLLIAILGGSSDPVAMGLALMNLALFGASTFYLWTPDSANFFKQQSVKPPQSAS